MHEQHRLDPKAQQRPEATAQPIADFAIKTLMQLHGLDHETARQCLMKAMETEALATRALPKVTDLKSAIMVL